MPHHVPLNVHGVTIDIYIFIDVPNSERKARGLQPFFQRMPLQHVQQALVKYPIFVIDRRPRGGSGGGTLLPGEVHGSMWNKENNTRVPNADIQRLILDSGKGLIFIPRNRWERVLNMLKFTVLHEVGHSVDYEMNLTPSGVSVHNYRGVRPVCGAGNLIKRYAVEAYARFVLGRSICRDEVDGERRNDCNQRVLRLLRQSPAFRSLPTNWIPGQANHQSIQSINDDSIGPNTSLLEHRRPRAVTHSGVRPIWRVSDRRCTRH